MAIRTFLPLISGILWTIVYLDSIRVGIKDKSYAMPLWALGLNIAWELIYAILGYQHSGLDMQTVINGIWFLFDIGLVYTYFRYGRKYFPQNVKPGWFPLWGALVIAVSFLIQVTFLKEFTYAAAPAYSAFLQNLLMSVLFIVMLIQRNSSEGQTMLIAVSKFLGSLAPTILIGIIGFSAQSEPSSFILKIGLLMALFDLIYIWLLSKVKRAEKNRGDSKILI
ncbi:MAG: hypothetical protein P8046_06105 [Anaerolineales bacterium]